MPEITPLLHHLKNGTWLPWVSKVDDTNQGYAGIYGRAIDAIEIK